MQLAFFIKYINHNGEILYKYIATNNEDVIDPIKENLIETPTIAATEDTRWTFKEWSNLPTNIQKP